MSEEEREEARPEWLPEKFKDTKQMAEAYKELEQKMSAQPAAQPEAQVAAEPEEPIAEESEPVDGEMDLSIDIEKAAQESWADEFSEEFNRTGKLSQESYRKLEKRGLPPKFVDAYIAGQKALVQERVQSLVGTVGGKAQYGELIDWARGSLNESEIKSFNELVTKGTPDQARLAILGLKARRDSETGTGSKLRQGTGAPSARATDGLEPFETLGQLIEAQSDPRYKTSPKYREAVMARLERSNF